MLLLITSVNSLRPSLTSPGLKTGRGNAMGNANHPSTTIFQQIYFIILPVVYFVMLVIGTVDTKFLQVDTRHQLITSSKEKTPPWQLEQLSEIYYVVNGSFCFIPIAALTVLMLSPIRTLE